MKRSAILASVAFAAAVGCGCAQARVGDGVRVEDAIASEAVVDRAALYVTLLNEGEAADTLTGVAVTGVERATIHATTGGRMSEVDRLELPPGDTVRLTVGGTHIMLEGAEGLTAGSTTEATLAFASGRTLTVPIRVVAYADLLESLER